MYFKKTFIAIFLVLITAPNFVFADDNIPSFFGFDTSSPQAWINSIYRYGISLGALLALAGLVYGGFRYLTSAGNEEAVTSGKQAIFAALSGLVIMLLSHMILKTMDPRLVELRLSMPEVDLPTQRCNSDSDCTSSQICSDGVCVSRDDSRSSTACNPDAPDQDREVCEGRLGVGSRCVDPPGIAPPVCSDPQLGQNERGCRDNEPRCNTGLACVRTATGNLCTDGHLNSPCSVSGDCESNNCLNNHCAEEAGAGRQGIGQPCENDEDCESDVCGLRGCVDGTSNTCRDDGDCQESYYCNTEARGGATYWNCQADLNNGATCYGDTWCTSGYCSGWDRFGGTCANRE